MIDARMLYLTIGLYFKCYNGRVNVCMSKGAYMSGLFLDRFLFCIYQLSYSVATAWIVFRLVTKCDILSCLDQVF